MTHDNSLEAQVRRLAAVDDPDDIAFKLGVHVEQVAKILATTPANWWVRDNKTGQGKRCRSERACYRYAQLKGWVDWNCGIGTGPQMAGEAPNSAQKGPSLKFVTLPGGRNGKDSVARRLKKQHRSNRHQTDHGRLFARPKFRCASLLRKDRGRVPALSRLRPIASIGWSARRRRSRGPEYLRRSVGQAGPERLSPKPERNPHGLHNRGRTTLGLRRGTAGSWSLLVPICVANRGAWR